VDDPSGVTYTVEIQQSLGGGAGYQQIVKMAELGSPDWDHVVGDMRERWRVWAVDGAGNTGAESAWRYMTKQAEEPEPDVGPGGTSPDY
jgi:hypothetical protein